jgi:hypothetical protein
MGAPLMAMTATERSRVLRERRAHDKIVLTIVMSEDELAAIARAGYAEAAARRSTIGGRALALPEGFLASFAIGQPTRVAPKIATQIATQPRSTAWYAS